MTTLTKKGALAVTADLDRLANLLQAEHETLGIPQNIARDFAYRADLLSDAIEKKAGFDPAEIGKEKAGPLEQMDSDEPFMQGEFTQQENRELREVQESGKMPGVVDAPRSPASGRQAGSFDTFGRQAAASQLDTAGATLSRAASENPKVAAGLTRLASKVLSLKANVLEGSASPDQVSQALGAVRQLLPHVGAEDQNKVAHLLALASKIVGGVDAGRRKDASHGYNLGA